MPHLSAMDWNFAEKLCHITRGTTEAYYNYDGNGIRTRKVVEKNGVVETRLYLGGFEIWRKSVNGALETERETLHVMDDKRRVALVETLTVENGNNVANPVPVQRYQLDNHLGSASLELDDSANIISYEEYYPYGDTSYRAGRSASEVSQKRYRYTGKEKDEESSLYYCEQRYYAAHISRWVSTDPTWLEDGINLYAYVHGNPLSGVDPSGTETVDEISPLPSDFDENARSSYEDYDDAKASKVLIDAIRANVSSELSDDGKKAIESIIEMIQNGSLDNEIYREGIEEKPELGSKAKPTNLKHLVGKDLYYIARARDYQIRNKTNKIPEYYIEYGNKYMFKFKYETKNLLSSQGKVWSDKTLRYLHQAMESGLQKSKVDMENDSWKLKNFAYETHPKAYIDAGLFDLPEEDWFRIVRTPDFADLSTPSGLEQIIKVGWEFVKQRGLSK
jgi:RHS repeat-associated protein